ncbi:uncharacterized protein YPO0396 [Sphaerotilus sulfidivorans]|uniref:Uncharacterized protein YPO0396 n=2 Tax=Sphaerotilus sulfidivorans TaxID=639200 RepID=A0ABV2ISP5_9BURK|nr:SbcC/MukB-like Walker B domain-containing protein [Sphaerotilus sulfidivorans]
MSTITHTLSLFPMDEQPVDAGARNQMKLRLIQLFNWGTFQGLLRVSIAEPGYLFVGPSGSGKSTILDAHAALTTPPRWVDFNVAAREAEKRAKDRNLMTYVRGAWAQQTTDAGEYAAQFLRTDTTWTAIAETYRDDHGHVVVLAQVLWVRGKSTSAADVKRLYLVLERELDLQELQFFPAHDFDSRRFKFDMPDAFVQADFSPYQERFRRLLGIDSERALRLLHKTQAAKNLGDLNDFMRDFMLEPPETFKLVDKLVDQFAELNEAHRAVVSARQQIETLRPAQEEAQQLEKARLARNELDELSAGVDKYKEQTRQRLLERAIAEQQTDLAGMTHEATRLDGLEKNEFTKLRSLQDQRSGMGGSLLEDLSAQLEAAETTRKKRFAKRESVRAACAILDWAPPDNALWFTQRRDAARAALLDADAKQEAQTEKTYSLRKQSEDAADRFRSVVVEIKALERQRSNIPARMLAVRERLADALGIREECLPFAGELIEVRQDEASWRGAIERVLHGFAQSLLVEDRHYAQVAAYLNETSVGERVVYLRMTPLRSEPRSPGENSLILKLSFADMPQADWVRNELKAHFDHDCAETVQAFRAAPRAITREGQIKHNSTRHEKNDRHRVDDPSRWVLGFDNAAKLSHFKQEAHRLSQQIEDLRQALEAARAAESSERERLKAHAQLANTEWDEVDVNSVIESIEALQSRIEREKATRPDLAKLDDEIKLQESSHERARRIHSDHLGRVRAQMLKIQALQRETEKLRPELLRVELTPFQQSGLDERYARYLPDMTWETVDNATTQVVRGINADEREASQHILQLEHGIERRLADFLRQWPAESDGLDARMASAPDFFAKLTRLQADGLPRHEQRFLDLLRDQSAQSLAMLQTQLDQERKAIRDRMALVNESLETTPFGPGTHLVIETQDKLQEDVLTFKRTLRNALSNMLTTHAQEAEQRFEVISTLVRRLASQETADRNWRALVLDVRQHVDFVARELNEFGKEVEVYRSGAGKSGGQRQKLAATCLAAALRYQLGGQERTLPRFSTVFLDEAFDKADAEFTAMAMNIFKTFGFQMIIATPLKSVMTLEPFIGGAGFVHIKDRKTSSVIPIDYDVTGQRLILSSAPDDDGEEAANA